MAWGDVDGGLARQITAATQEPNGFPIDPLTGEVDRASSIMSYDDGTRTFTIEPVDEF